MAEQAELAFVKNFVNALSTQPVVYPNDYQQAPANELKKVPVLPVSAYLRPRASWSFLGHEMGTWVLMWLGWHG